MSIKRNNTQMCHRGQGGPKTEKCCLLQKLFLAYAYSFFILGTMSDHFICAYLCWQIDIRESEHSIDWRGRGQNVTKFVFIVQFHLISLLPCFIILDTYYYITSSLLVYSNHFRGVMKIRFAVTLVVLGLLYVY